MSKLSLIDRAYLNNYNTYISKLSFDDILSIIDYMDSIKNIRKKPNKMIEDFMDEFFGLDKWYKYVAEVIKESSFFKDFQMQAEVNKIYQLLSFDALNMARAKLLESDKKIKSLELKKEILNKNHQIYYATLKHKLKAAINNSYIEDGIFDKIEGFLNISDVLLAEKLIKFE